MSGDEGLVIGDHRRGISAIRAAEFGDDRIVGVQVDIGHRAEIDGETEPSKGGGHTSVNLLGGLGGISGGNAGGTGNFLEAHIAGQPLDRAPS
ncbi:hypothetical protein N8D56_13720 [Devosia sp. A8/3-2]|nr:hypothetical protein N8D56_13720 [Devosia sp. A8/3-2]